MLVSGGIPLLWAVISNKCCNFYQMQYQKNGNYTWHFLLKSKSNSYKHAWLKEKIEERVTILSSVKKHSFITLGNEYWIQMTTTAFFLKRIMPPQT